MVEPSNGATYGQQLLSAEATKDLGYSGWFRSDHYLHMGGNGLPGPSDAWASLAALAHDVDQIRLGTLVSPVTFRAPGVLAILAAQVDQMSGGRVEVGLGAGWYAAEHRAVGLPFPPLPQRYAMLEETLEILRGWWDTDQPFDYDGSWYALDDAPGLPKPVQRRVPVILGGTGPMVCGLAAEYGDELNVAFVPQDRVVKCAERLRRYERIAGRHPGAVRLSAALTLCMGRTDAQVLGCADRIDRGMDELRAKSPLVGTRNQVVDQLGAWTEATGVQRIYVQALDISDIDQLQQFADAIEL